jgi:uncharacterized protein YjiS (DUF1127 family)
MHVTATAGSADGARSARKRILRLIAQRLFEALQRSRQRRALAALSDHQLHDVGLTRVDFMRRTAPLGRSSDANDSIVHAPQPFHGRRAIRPQCDGGHTDREE